MPELVHLPIWAGIWQGNDTWNIIWRKLRHLTRGVLQSWEFSRRLLVNISGRHHLLIWLNAFIACPLDGCVSSHHYKMRRRTSCVDDDFNWWSTPRMWCGKRVDEARTSLLIGVIRWKGMWLAHGTHREDLDNTRNRIGFGFTIDEGIVHSYADPVVEFGSAIVFCTYQQTRVEDVFSTRWLSESKLKALGRVNSGTRLVKSQPINTKRFLTASY